jgi:hypothetical protein
LLITCLLLLLLLLLSLLPRLVPPPGLLKVDAMVFNQLSVSPMLLSLPSNLSEPFTTNFTVTWTGPSNPSRDLVVYNIVHQPSKALTISDGWYKTDMWHWNAQGGLPTEYRGPFVKISPTRISINSADPTPQSVQVSDLTLTQ